MARKTTKTTPVRRLLDLAARQFGAFSLDQAAALGVGRHQVRGLLKRGAIRRRWPGTFVVSGAPSSYEQSVMVAILSGPDGAVASHETAAFLHGLLPPPSDVHVTVEPRHRVRMPNVVGHRSIVPATQRAMIGPIPVTNLHRTVVDLASVMDLDTFAGVLDPLLTAGRVAPDRLLRTLDDIVAAPGRHGTTLLRTALDVWLRPIEPGSPAEARLLRRLSERGFDGFETQFEVTVDGKRYRLDVAWPGNLCALEYTGAEAHGPRQWPRDEPRMSALKRAGWKIRDVDAVDVLPARRQLWDWLDARLRRVA